MKRMIALDFFNNAFEKVKLAFKDCPDVIYREVLLKNQIIAYFI